MKKTIYTLAVNDYAPKICELTFPLMERYANKIGADFYVIKDRKFPDMPPVYEKFQIYELSKERGDDWSFYIDADCLVHPDFWDVTAMLEKNTTCSAYMSDFTPQRFKPDEYFLRDGRFLGKGNWFMIFSDWTRDVYHPLDDISFEEAESRITPIIDESSTVVTAGHLIDDYLTSRNIARFGLKHTLISEQKTKFNTPDPAKYLWHNYTVSNDRKVVEMHQAIINWAQEVFTFSLPDGRKIYKPIISGNTPEEQQADLIVKAQALVNSWMGKEIPTLQLRSMPAPSTAGQTQPDLSPIQIADGKPVMVGEQVSIGYPVVDK